MDAALVELESLSRSVLAERWEEAFKVPTPKSCQAPLLRCALAFELQAAGSRSVASASTSLRRAAGSRVALSAGTRLLREWQGQTHAVTVIADGYEYQGKVWRSLSAIASSITGTHWSGPLFFGLRS